MSDDKKPLGYVELKTGAKAIYAMNDFFLNYMFDKTDNWETLRLLVNIILEAYIQKYPSHGVKLIKGNIVIETQYKYFLDIQNVTRNQDIKMTENDDNTIYIEFQNRASISPTIESRAIEYFGLGIGHGNNKIADQLWLLSEDVNSVLHGEIFTNYALTDKVTSNPYPKGSSIMFVSLQKLSKEKSPAGELALFLLGRTQNPQNENVQEIAKKFNNNLNLLKTDKEAYMLMTVKDSWLNEGRDEGLEEGIIIGRNEGRKEGRKEGRSEGRKEGRSEGRNEGIAVGAQKLLDLLKSGLSPEEAYQRVLGDFQPHPE
ncbi:MAG: hypothetical protein LBI27_08200 [Clostridiales bacterium]|jgi:hypothetical protein|nr:hypothetical protein [Clostridiales bacterium]